MAEKFKSGTCLRVRVINQISNLIIHTVALIWAHQAPSHSIVLTDTHSLILLKLTSTHIPCSSLHSLTILRTHSHLLAVPGTYLHLLVVTCSYSHSLTLIDTHSHLLAIPSTPSDSHALLDTHWFSLAFWHSIPLTKTNSYSLVPSGIHSHLH